MPTVAYLTNRFPSPVEPYVAQEIHELRKNWVSVIPCSARCMDAEKLSADAKSFPAETLYLQPLKLKTMLHAAWFALTHIRQFADLLERVVAEGKESLGLRVRALLHTWLGIYFAILLKDRGVGHIHVHHGYFSSWIAMVAARVLGISFSVTLHGSDLLVKHAYLDTKLKHCRFCITISEFNRAHILEHYPAVEADKIIVQHMGVDIPTSHISAADENRPKFPLLLSVGRLHPVKDHAFLVRACAELHRRGLPALCLIAGEGSERRSLERLIRRLGLSEEVGLLGHVPHEQLDAHFAMADLVVLTSRSEGVPLVLMEAMAMGNIVLAPEITGIPELVIHGETGFLYKPGSLEDFAAKVQMIWELRPALDPIRRAARKHVLQNFNRDKNLAEFADMFLHRIAATRETRAHEDSVLQQI